MVGETSCPIVFGEVQLGVMRRRKEEERAEKERREEERAGEEERSSTNSSSGEFQQNFAICGLGFIQPMGFNLSLDQELPQLPKLVEKITQWRNL